MVWSEETWPRINRCLAADQARISLDRRKLTVPSADRQETLYKLCSSAQSASQRLNLKAPSRPSGLQERVRAAARDCSTQEWRLGALPRRLKSTGRKSTRSPNVIGETTTPATPWVRRIWLRFAAISQVRGCSSSRTPAETTIGSSMPTEAATGSKTVP